VGQFKSVTAKINFNYNKINILSGSRPQTLGH